MKKKELNILVGTNIKKEREKAGLTQEQFSELLGIGSKSLSAIERGVVGVSLTTLLNICEVLHISTNMILFEQNQRNNTDNIISQLEKLNSKQLDIVSEVIKHLLKAFSLEK